MCKSSVWSGQPLTGAALAIQVNSGPDWHLDVQDATGRHQVSEPDLGRFLVAHADRRLVCQHAGEFHAALERALGADEAKATEVLWGFSRKGQLFDTSLLQQLVNDAAQWSAVGRSEYAELELNDSAALLGKYQDLIQKADDVVDRLGTAGAAARFGPLGLAVEVQARVAAHYLSRNGLELVAGARDRLRRAGVRVGKDLVEKLWADRGARKILDNKGNRKGQRPEEVQGVRQCSRLKRWLDDVGGTLVDLHDWPLPLPRLIQEQAISTFHHDWRRYAAAHPLIAAWVQLMDVRTLDRFLETLKADQIHPDYWTVDGIRSLEPSIETMLTLGETNPLFHARPGHCLMVVRLADLPLRALGSVLDGLPEPSALAAVLRRYGNPIKELATRLEDATTSATFPEIEAMPQEIWIEIARTVLSLASTGHSFKTIRLMLASTGIRLTDTEVMHLLLPVLEYTYQELDSYLRYPVVERIVHYLEISEEEWARAWKEYMPDDPDPHPSKIGRSFLGDWGDRYPSEVVMNFLHKVDNRQVKLSLPDRLPEAFKVLTAMDWVGPTGRVYGHSQIWDSFGKTHLLVADAARKRVLYELARTGFTVCAIVDDTILLEQAGGSNLIEAACTRIEELLHPVLAEFLGSIPSGLTVEVCGRYPFEQS